MQGAVKQIQIIGDEIVMLLAVSRAYRDRAIKIVAATHIDEAIKQTQDFYFSLFILDLDVKDGRAFEILEWMTKNFPKRPAILMTTADSQSFQLVEKIDKMRPQSCWHILEKPFVYKKLVGFIDRAMQLSEYSFESITQYNLTNCLEKRRCHRILDFLQTNIPYVYDPESSSFQSYLFADQVNLSIGGMGVVTRKALVPDEILYFGEEFMHPSGIVIWNRRKKDGIYESGIRFD